MEVGIEDGLHIEFEYNKSKYASFIYISLTSGTTCMNRNRVPLLMCRKHNIKLKVHCVIKIMKDDQDKTKRRLLNEYLHRNSLRIFK